MSSLMRWDPFRGMLRMEQELDRMFDRLLGRRFWPLEAADEGVRIPSVDVSEDENEVVVKAELPGIDKDKINLEVTPEQLSLSAEMSEEKEEKQATYHRRERVWGCYQRTISLPAEVVSDQAKATYRDGLLTVRLPKSERAKATTPRKVAVE